DGFLGGFGVKPPLCSQEQSILAQRASQLAWSLSVAGARNFQIPAHVLSLPLAQRARQDNIFCFGILMALRASMGL
ncbi:hypothetical protein A2U01_0096629, partial [Trifolium medium]|nr:hypothetical protein [Trifolium medium]